MNENREDVQGQAVLSKAKIRGTIVIDAGRDLAFNSSGWRVSSSPLFKIDIQRAVSLTAGGLFNFQLSGHAQQASV